MSDNDNGAMAMPLTDTEIVRRFVLLCQGAAQEQVCVTLFTIGYTV